MTRLQGVTLLVNIYCCLCFFSPPPQYPPPVFLVASGTKGPRLWGGGARLGTAPLPCTPLLPHLGEEDKGVGDAGRGVGGPHGRPKSCWGGSRCRGTATGWRNQTSVSGVGRHRSRGVTREIGRGGRTPGPSCAQSEPEGTEASAPPAPSLLRGHGWRTARGTVPRAAVTSCRPCRGASRAALTRAVGKARRKPRACACLGVAFVSREMSHNRHNSQKELTNNRKRGSIFRV